MIMWQLVGSGYMALSPSERLEAVQAIQRLAAAARDAERERPRDPRDAHDFEMTRRLVMRLRLREFRNLTMSFTELAELRDIERDIERDREQRLDDDWTRR
jgi:hypothetical protein